MARFKLMWVLKGIVFVLVVGTLLGGATMYLWNWLVPDLFGGPVISFLQALGLLALVKILLPGFWHRKQWGHEKRKHWKRKWEDKLSKMSPEEREKCKRAFEKRCGSWGHGPFSDQSVETNVDESSEQQE